VDLWNIGATWRKWIAEGGAWNGISGPGFFLLLIYAFWLPWGERMSATHFYHHDILPHLILKTMDSANLEMKFLKPWAKTNFSSFKIVSSIYHSDKKKLTHKGYIVV
jgi:hypothetical protein